MKGKWVHLQRLRAGTWKTIARKKLVRKPSLVWGAFNHEVFFPLTARGWTLRAYLPRKSALPCYKATTTSQWRS
jgi:hypothetical protein